MILWALLAGGAAACPAAQAATQLNTAPAGNSGSVNAPRIPRTPDADSASEADPLEPLNRGIYQFNYVFDGVLLKPMTLIYQGVVPEQGQVMVSHFLENIYTPVVFVNSVLQGDPKNTFRTLCRFVINTTLGIGGLFDVASDMGIRNRPADFGETLAFWGAGPGPYIELPIAGPSDLRDAFGRLGDAFMTPTNYAKNAVWISVWAATAIDERSKNMELLDGIYSSSLDPYATLRSAYIQKRASDIRRGKIARDKAWTFCTERHPQ
ncbi:MAG: VacJ family lipoprotein [Pseudomonadota bacterium]|nr:VacJ family lipoprotein [Pseudomonadota bacterium]